MTRHLHRTEGTVGSRVGPVKAAEMVVGIIHGDLFQAALVCDFSDSHQRGIMRRISDGDLRLQHPCGLRDPRQPQGPELDVAALDGFGHGFSQSKKGDGCGLPAVSPRMVSPGRRAASAGR
jgi:hypothetical protein